MIKMIQQPFTTETVHCSSWEFLSLWCLWWVSFSRSLQKERSFFVKRTQICMEQLLTSSVVHPLIFLSLHSFHSFSPALSIGSLDSTMLMLASSSSLVRGHKNFFSVGLLKSSFLFDSPIPRRQCFGTSRWKHLFWPKSCACCRSCNSFSYFFKLIISLALLASFDDLCRILPEFW